MFKVLLIILWWVSAAIAATSSTCSQLPNFVCLSGRGGGANDITIDTGGSNGNIHGSSQSGWGLNLESNTVDSNRGYITVGALSIAIDSGATHPIDFYAGTSGAVTRWNDGSGNYVEVQALPALGTNYTYSLPANYQPSVISDTPGTDQNNYAPTGIDIAAVIRVTPSAAISITGLRCGAAADCSASYSGRMITIINTSTTIANIITIASDSGSSTAANRFRTGGLSPTAIVLRNGRGVTFWYDSTSLRWRPFANTTPANDDSLNAGGVISGTVAGDPADSGIVRLGNAESICWENNPTGTDACLAGTTDLTWSDFSGISHTVATLDATQVLTGKTINAESTGNIITLPMKISIPAASCNVSTAVPNWDVTSATAPLPVCEAGTNNKGATLDFDDTADECIQLPGGIMLPDDWTGALDVKYMWKAAATTGAVGWCSQFICTAANETDDNAFPAQTSSNCVSATVAGTTLMLNSTADTSVTSTGCAAGELMRWQLCRDGNGSAVTDSMTGDAKLVNVELTMRRAM